MDEVFVTDLTLQAIIGIHPEERSNPQPVLVSFTFYADTREAARADRITAAVDYEAAARQITELVTASRFQLIETMAERIAALLLADYPIQRVAVEVRKPTALRNADAVGVRIERSA